MSQYVSINIQLPLEIIESCLSLLFNNHQNDQLKQIVLNHLKPDINQNEIDDIVHICKTSDDCKQTSDDQSSTLNVIKNLDDEKFHQILEGIGFTNEDMLKAKQLRDDLKNGKELNMNQVTQLIQHYKNNNQFDFAKVSELISLFQSSTTTTTTSTSPAAPSFDLNQISNLLSPMLQNLNLNNNRQKRRGYHSRQK
ncbi:MAG TPA: hypothetical protein VLG50_05175 [Candidatus Saccharimonadales bacterium]|nr:hypothetical protein [Candidatus Saccharimonadales bacterium]